MLLELALVVAAPIVFRWVTGARAPSPASRSHVVRGPRGVADLGVVAALLTVAAACLGSAALTATGNLSSPGDGDGCPACDWCGPADPTDCALFVLPDVLLEYVLAVAVVGFATIAPRKRGWRIWAAAGIAGAAVCEATLQLQADTLIVMSPGGRANSLRDALATGQVFGFLSAPLSLAASARAVRRSVFGLVAAALAVVDAKVSAAEADRIRFAGLRDRLAATLMRQQAARLVRSSSSGGNTSGEENAQVGTDQYNAMVNNAKALAGSILQIATIDGLVANS
ncbi:hypothetical protein HDU84_001408 [Entophlyctis sp. JEL0112]|nr:hypothetical protein HDU84_001408 [Entophlyctis sp. JEL0112]